MNNKIRKAFAFILSLMLFYSALNPNVFAYYENAGLADEEYEKSIEIEAEDFSSGEGFQIIADETCSGGKAIRGSGKAGARVAYPFELEGYATDIVVYVVHKAKNEMANLSFLSVDYFERNAIYANEFGKQIVSRIYFGEFLGKHTIYLESARYGHEIDKIIIKYNVKKTEKIDSVEYMEGNPEIEKLDIKEVEERTPGSFFFEAEDGITEDFAPYNTYVEDETASGGAYWHAKTGAVEYLDPLKDERRSLQFKFYISEPGSYVLWIRNLAPEANMKSSWFAIDNKDYTRIDQGTVGSWVWNVLYNGLNTKYLDTGWHTLDVKMRQNRHRIDCLILTKITAFTPSGKGFLPGEKPDVDEALQANYDSSRGTSKFKTETFRMRSDVQFKEVKGDYYIPANNIAQVLGVEYEKHDYGYIIRSGRNYLKIYPGEKRYVANGVPVYSSYVPYEVESICMVPLSMVKKAFDFDSVYCSDESTLFVFSEPNKEYRTARQGEVLSIEQEYDNDAYIKVPYSNPDAEVEIWLRTNLSDKDNQKISDYDGMSTLISGGYNYGKHDLNTAVQLKFMNWTKMSAPYYKDGAFYARRFNLRPGSYDVKVRIVDGGKEDVFVAEKVFTNIDKANSAALKYGNAEGFQEFSETKTNGELLAIPTFENAGLYIDTSFDNMAECKFYYRKTGEQDWSKGYKPFFDEQINQFRGSIVNLSSDTEYEFRAVIYDENKNVLSEKETKAKTWSDNPPIGKQLKLSDVYDGEGTLYLVDMEGSDDAWIEIDCEGQTIDAGANNMEAVYIGHCKNIIFKNAVVKGGSEHGITVNSLSEKIRLINCDVSGWGPGDGIYSDSLHVYYNNGEYYNYNGGIQILYAKDIVVERCYVHDANMKTNQWYPEENVQEHPCGSSGLFIGAIRGLVVRYCNIIGSDEHRFNDAIEGHGNNSYAFSSTGHNSDVYGNMLYCTDDDSIELDGCGMNVRFYKNRMEQSMCGISHCANTMGPSYIFNNLCRNMGEEAGTHTLAMKVGGRFSANDPHVGYMFIFNNTFINQIGIGNVGISGTSDYHATSRNNIWLSEENKISYHNNTNDYRDDNDYDMLSNPGATIKEGDGQHSLYSTIPDFEAAEKGNYFLKKESAGVDAGEVLDNFTTAYTGKSVDMGAFETDGELKFLPYRPCDFSANAYSVELKDKEEFEIIVKIGEVNDAKSFRVVKNNDFDWIELSKGASEVQSLVPNSEYKFKVKVNIGDTQRNRRNGMVLFMLDNGFAIPITVTGVNN